ncbi:hypothetical protein [Zavarzinia sp. CC-PAN008]|uniref:hypothetical protein n=1 Tax=Zavarzinia sp. CC-PAN008 TaxID=3243332 RepID=UPI003F74916E
MSTIMLVSHERLVAIEWYLRRLYVERFATEPDPVAAAQALLAEADAFGAALCDYAQTADAPPEAVATSTEIASELKALGAGILEDTRAAAS